MGLEELRQEIDGIDQELLKLLLRRMDVSRRVAEEKRKTGTPVLNSKREREILESIGAQSGSFADAMKVIYATIMDVSRASQHQMLGGGAALRWRINQALSKQGGMDSPRVACAGVRGAYAHEAATRLFPTGDSCFCSDFEEVFVAVRDGVADYGVIPVENSTAGSVHEVYDLIVKYRFYVTGALDLPVSHCLLGMKGGRKEDVKKVYSHHQAISQCSDYIKKNNLEAVTYANTAMAAKMVAESAEQGSAAIASRQTAELYGLEVLDEGIQTSRNNATRFIVIARELAIQPDADKISLIFSLSHTTGSLYRVLGRFAMCGLNLTKIESRPIQGRAFEYHFYLDFSGHVNEPRIINLLCALSDELPSFSFLGNYKEAQA